MYKSYNFLVYAHKRQNKKNIGALIPYAVVCSDYFARRRYVETPIAIRRLIIAYINRLFKNWVIRLHFLIATMMIKLISIDKVFDCFLCLNCTSFHINTSFLCVCLSQLSIYYHTFKHIASINLNFFKCYIQSYNFKAHAIKKTMDCSTVLKIRNHIPVLKHQEPHKTFPQFQRTE